METQQSNQPKAEPATVPAPIKHGFDFMSSDGVLKASQAVAQAAYDQAIPIQNIVGATRAINCSLRLAELQLRFLQFKKKHKEDTEPSIAALS